ncbi:MAG: hypothetical protein IT307_18515 [Chloroflexi bacterium]|nr:hypothetical protein [Chloroflexota bacterium]
MSTGQRVRKEIVSLNDVATPLGHHSQGVRAGHLLFLSGQIASGLDGIPAEARINPEFPNFGSAIRRQTRVVMENLGALLEAGGSSFDQVVKTWAFLEQASDFDSFTETYTSYFTADRPARTTLQMGSPAMVVPGCRVGIDFIAVSDPSVERLAFNPPDVPGPHANYSMAVRAGELVFLAGQLASDGRTGIAREAQVNPEMPFHGSPIEKQTRYILENTRRTLEAAGSSLEQVVKAQVFLRDPKHFAGFDQVWREFFPTSPPRTIIQMASLIMSDCLIEIDLIGAANGTPVEVINSDRAPRPLANYHQATKVGPYIFLAGQLASDFRNGVAPEAQVDPRFPYYDIPIERQTEYILKNCQVVLEEARSSLDQVVKAQVFLTDMSDFHGLNKVWRRFFPEDPPALSVVRTDGAGLLVPGCLVEIDLIAVEADA